MGSTSAEALDQDVQATPAGRASAIFVAGPSRSGTTMMGRILGLHPDVHMLNELHFFERLWSPADRNRRLSAEEAAELVGRLMSHERELGVRLGAHPERFLDEARAVVAEAGGDGLRPTEAFLAAIRHEARRNGTSVPCDQTPRYVFYLADILELDPDVRVVVMVRDARDVLASQKRKWRLHFHRGRAALTEALRLKLNYHPITTSLLWKAAIEAGDRFADHPRVRVVRFEDVMAEPEREIRELCAFLGLPFDERMLDVSYVGSSYGQSYGGVDDRAAGIVSNAAGRWRRGGLRRSEVALCQRVAGEQLRRHGYEIEPVEPSKLDLAATVALFPVKAALALPANLRTVRSLPDFLRRRLSAAR